MTSVESLGEALLDEALVARLVPWPCPSDFGPDNRYRLEEIVGVGKTALVYRAIDTHMSSRDFDAVVAIKIVGAEGRQRQEALNARRVRHDNVVRILDRGVTEDGTSFIVEDLVEGSSLEAQSVPWPARGAVEFMVKVARGMQAVHAAGVVHCDLKPGNVLITESGEPKISDFGLASTGEVDDATGGNLAFISPERYQDPVAGLAPPTDVYALAGLLFYLLTGKSPHGETIEEAKAYLDGQDPPPPANVDPVLDAICDRSLSRDPARRHHSAGELADDLESWLRREPIRWTRPGMWQELSLFVRRHSVGVVVGVVVIAALLAVLGGWLGLQAQAIADQRRANQEVVRKAEQQIEEVREKVRTSIRTLMHMIPHQSGLDFSAHYLGSLLWLDQLVAHPLLEQIRTTTVDTERIAVLRELSGDLRAVGDGPTLATLLTDHSLAFLLLKQGEWRGSLDVSEPALDAWQGKLDTSEPIWISLSAMREAAMVLRDRAEGADIEPLEARLDALDLADMNGCLATHQLIQQVRSSLSDQPD